MKLDKKVAVITGGSRGIGYATADKFLSEGAKVILTASSQESADQAVAKLREKYPVIKILVLTTFYDDDNITKAIANGADGYLLKDSGKEAILGAIEQILNGRNVIDHKVMLRLAALMGAKEPQKEAKREDLAPDMTEREKEICTLLAEGLTNRQIAEQLYISEGTVKNYISSIYDKTGIHDRAKLIVAMKG